VLHILAFDDEGSHVVDDPDRISDLLEVKGTVVWADLTEPGPADLDLMAEEFGLHPLAVEDAIKHGQRPKIELYEDHAFVVAYAADTRAREMVEVDFFVGQNWVITVHDRAEGGGRFVVEHCQERVRRLHPKRTTAPFMFYVVLDAIVDTYFGMSEMLGEEVDDIEDRIFDDPDPEDDDMALQREMLDIRKRLLRVRKRIVPLREVLLTLLRDDVPWLSGETRQYLQDVLDHVMRVTDEIDMRRELIGNAVDAHLALTSNHMNRTMKRMTSWGAILIIATIVTGIYGMNFDDMPELHWALGYPWALTLMVVLPGAAYLYFRKRRWL
jgi:magnesium transporter